MIKVFLVSLGCDKNRVDGEEVLGHLLQEGYILADEAEDADAILINTCGFIKEAVQESLDMIFSLAKYKKEGKCRLLIVLGCMTQRYKNEAAKALPEADAIYGINEIEAILGKMKEVLGRNVNTPACIDRPRILARIKSNIPHIAYIKISDGCDNNCTYCTIPIIRGGYRSRPMEDILSECQDLIKAGAKELVLVAQDTALYGTDIYKEPKLHELLRKMAELEGITWVRLMYAYPEHITDEIIQAIKELPFVCKYLDMPIQHSEPKILAKMGRKGNKRSLEELICKLRKEIPGIIIRTTLMVGFPGETSSEYDRLCEFVEKMKFDRLGVFPYSKEEGTPAASIKPQVRLATMLARKDELMMLQQAIHFSKQSARVGMKINVMVDAKTDNNMWLGRSMGDAYEVDTVVYITGASNLSVGDVISVRIVQSVGYDLKGVAE